MKQNIRTLLFDLDGTLINTNDLIIESFKHTFAHYGLNFSLEEIITFNGPPLQQTFQKIGGSLADEMVVTYREHNFRFHNEYVKPFPHVLETIQTLEDQGFELGIVTTKMRKAVELGLEITDLKPFFKTIITLNDVTHAKPHPEPVLKAMQELQGEPQSTLMIGDNSHDIEAGHNAGVLTAGVAWAQRGETYLKQYKPTYMLGDMTELLDIVLEKQ